MPNLRDKPITFSRERAEQIWSGTSPLALIVNNADLQRLSEVGVDYFYWDYYDVLRPVVDARYPQAARFRKFLNTSFIAANDLNFVLSPGSAWGHESHRCAGKVEFLLFQGFYKNFSSGDEPRVSIFDIRAAAITIWDNDIPYETEDESDRHDRFRQALRRCINAQELVEISMDDAQQQYFRRALLRYIKEWGDIE